MAPSTPPAGSTTPGNNNDQSDPLPRWVAGCFVCPAGDTCRHVLQHNAALGVMPVMDDVWTFDPERFAVLARAAGVDVPATPDASHIGRVAGALGLTPTDMFVKTLGVAGWSGIDDDRVCLIEDGRVTPTADEVAALATELRITPADLFDESESPRRL